MGTTSVNSHSRDVFTTKPAGKGTGLGLATVYGIVKQNRPGLTIVDLASLDVEGLEMIRSIRMADAGAVLIAIVGDGRSPLTAAASDLGVADVINRHEDATQILQLMNDACHDEPGSSHSSAECDGLPYEFAICGARHDDGPWW